MTLAIGVVWLALAALTGVGYLVADFDSVKGLLQRIDQVLFGAWLVLLAVGRKGWRAQPASPETRRSSSQTASNSLTGTATFP